MKTTNTTNIAHITTKQQQKECSEEVIVQRSSYSRITRIAVDIVIQWSAVYEFFSFRVGSYGVQRNSHGVQR